MRNGIMVALALYAGFCGIDAYAMDLSLNDAIQKIVAESHDLKKADANLKKAQASLDVANSARWFNVEGTATYMNLINVEKPFDSYNVKLPPEIGGLVPQMAGITNIEVPDNIFMAGVTVTQPIYTFGKIGNAVDSVRSAIKMSEFSKEMVSREVKYAAADMYWTAKMTDEIVKIAKKDLNNARDAKRNIAVAGRANRGNLVKIESDIATKEINLSDAEFNRDTAHRMLKILAGIDVDEPLNLTDEFPDSFPEMTVKKLADTPEWQVLDQQVKMYESKASSQRANGYPTLAAVGSYNYVTMDKDFKNTFNENGTQSAYLGLALKVPIFSGGVNRANATVDAMNAEAARQDLDKSKKITAEKYRNAIQQYNHLRDNLDGLENARNLAAKAYNFSRERFAAGQTSAVELADVSSGLYQLDMALLNAKYKILMSQESVKKLGE
ncbi:MAG: TolC family protein [Alphaproteobacteria bacterium]|jgi:outer membrane protein TolC|nr:TolC family protein [Alphaproteobacteria bacterium]